MARNTQLSPQGYNLGSEPFNENPFWGSGGGGGTASISVGEVTTHTGLPGTDADVEIDNVGSSSEAVFDFDFTIPAGAKGDKGDKGNDGDKGDKGDPGEGIASGGTAGQVLTKYGDEDYQTHWTTPAYVPDPADQNGKFLKSIGSDYMWDSIPQELKTTVYPLGPMTAEKFDELKAKFDTSNFVNNFLLAKQSGISFNVSNATNHQFSTTFTSSGSQTTEQNVPLNYGYIVAGMLEYAGISYTSDSAADEDIEEIYFISRAYGSATRFVLRKVTTTSTGIFKEIRIRVISEISEQLSYLSGGYVTSCSIYDGAEGTATGGSAIMIYEKG